MKKCCVYLFDYHYDIPAQSKKRSSITKVVHAKLVEISSSSGRKKLVDKNIGIHENYRSVFWKLICVFFFAVQPELHKLTTIVGENKLQNLVQRERGALWVDNYQ